MSNGHDLLSILMRFECMMRGNGMDNEHIISAGESVLFSGSTHQRRKIDEHSTLAVDSICSCGDSIHRRRKMGAMYVKRP